ncbi:carbon-nitrogen hydrolase family protein [Litorisediminicola beolgyonensis]|uniref:Carbon-nitrogen hydrolase family protein n=1 Tax=Litorisediminicola beolgyonensis TaxID=1173614 RepID=A0ABW3ZJW2_9RHOB
MTVDGLRIALWQGGGTSGAVRDNLDEIAIRAGQASQEGAGLLVFPECFLTGYVTKSPHDIVEDVTENVTARLARISRETGLALVVGSYAKCNGRLSNAAFVFDPQKGLIGTYRKQMLYGDWEKGIFQRGTAPLTFTFRKWRIGLLICFDVEFPETVRHLARQQCDLIVVPTALMKPFEPVAQHLIATRALENQVFVAYANRTGTEGSQTYLGQSTVAGPDGKTIVAAEGAEECLLLADLYPGGIALARADFVYLDEIGL